VLTPQAKGKLENINSYITNDTLTQKEKPKQRENSDNISQLTKRSESKLEKLRIIKTKPNFTCGKYF
jgi:hypothetical protein